MLSRISVYSIPAQKGGEEEVLGIILLPAGGDQGLDWVDFIFALKLPISQRYLTRSIMLQCGLHYKNSVEYLLL